MTVSLSPITSVAAEIIATATFAVQTKGTGFIDITQQAAEFIAEAGGKNGALLVFTRHTSASLVIQENADPDVQLDLVTAFDRLAPANTPWVHDAEGSDDMPAHVKTAITGVSLHVPVIDGSLALGTWQGIYLVEHRTRPHRREIILQFIGGRR